jgi:hypothetical protein
MTNFELAKSYGYRLLKGSKNESFVRKGVEIWYCRRNLQWVWCSANFVKNNYSNHKYFLTLENAILGINEYNYRENDEQIKRYRDYRR